MYPTEFQIATVCGDFGQTSDRPTSRPAARGSGGGRPRRFRRRVAASPHRAAAGLGRGARWATSGPRPGWARSPGRVTVEPLRGSPSVPRRQAVGSNPARPRPNPIRRRKVPWASLETVRRRAGLRCPPGVPDRVVADLAAVLGLPASALARLTSPTSTDTPGRGGSAAAWAGHPSGCAGVLPGPNRSSRPAGSVGVHAGDVPPARGRWVLADPKTGRLRP